MKAMIEMYKKISWIFSGEEMVCVQTHKVQLPSKHDFICIYNQIGPQAEAERFT